LFVYNCNPAVTVPDQNAVLNGLKRDDLFTVVHDQLLTDTARYADIILPATTFLEHHDIRKAYGAYVIGGVHPVMPRQGESRTNFEVFAELGRAMGFEDEAFGWDTDEAIDKLISAIDLDGKPADRELLTAGKTQVFDFPGTSPVQFETVLPRTPDEKIQLAPEVLGKDPYRFKPHDSEKYPLAFISPSSTKTTNSTFGEWSIKRLELTIHPIDAERRNVREGDTLRVHNSLGELICHARVSDRVRTGVVMMPKGAWMKVSQNGRTSTALCPADVSEVGGSACYNDARVEVELTKSS
jgi:anaerobic selenocysteine-containing dehydrogenase